MERPVDVMRDVVIEKPVTTYEQREMAVPQATAKDVDVQVRTLSAAFCSSHLNHVRYFEFTPESVHIRQVPGFLKSI